MKVAPAGLAFQAVYQREKTMGQDPLASGSLFLQLYGPDFIHPAVPGTFLAACVVTATIYGVDPTTLTGSVAVLAIQLSMAATSSRLRSFLILTGMKEG